MTKKIKVMQIGGNLRYNGISTSIMEIYRRLHEEFEYIFINTAEGGGPYRAEIEKLGGRVYDVLVKGKGPVRSWRQAREIRRIIRIERPYVVHSHYFSNNGIYLQQAFLEGVPVRISHCHQSNENDLKLSKRIATRSSRRRINKYATLMLGCSEKARKFLYGDKGSVFYAPVDFNRARASFDRQKALERYSLPLDRVYFSFIGRFVEQKNIPFLLDVIMGAVRKNSKISLLMVGAGTDEERTYKMISERGLKDHVLIIPKTQEIEEVLFISNCMLLPSLFEGLSLVTLQAQAIGTECIVSTAVPEEAQMGLVTFLPLDEEKWVDEILARAEERQVKSPRYSAKFDVECLAPIMANHYRNITSEEWINQGREYALGSKRFIRNKSMSHLCFRSAHEMGDMRGAFHFALSFFEGNGTEQDKRRAQDIVAPIVNPVEILASKGDPEYLTILGDMYSFGLGKEQDYEKAFHCYLKAADDGNLEAQCDLGYMYLVGQGVAKDERMSTFWWKRSADAGYVHSMRDVGQNYLEGIGTERDRSEACRYFQMASENNYSHGTTDLAYCYIDGPGVKKDLERAAELFILALAQDEERAVRDMIARGIDVGELRNGRRLVFRNDTRIDEVDENNSFAGTVCVNGSIEHVDPGCFYDAHGIRKFFVERANMHYAGKEGVLFNRDMSVLIRYPPGNKGREYRIPETVKVVGPRAFQNCRSLESILIPDSVTSIDDSAFDDCKSLIRVNIPDGTLTIGDWCFHGCDRLERIAIPEKTELIGNYAFGSCESLKEISVNERNRKYCSVDGDLYSKDMRTILQYAIGKGSSSFLLPDPVETIGFRAFSDAYQLVEIDCANASIVSEKAFYYAIKLKKAVFRNDPSIGKDAFLNNSPDFHLVIKGEQ